MHAWGCKLLLPTRKWCFFLSHAKFPIDTRRTGVFWRKSADGQFVYLILGEVKCPNTVNQNARPYKMYGRICVVWYLLWLVHQSFSTSSVWCQVKEMSSSSFIKTALLRFSLKPVLLSSPLSLVSTGTLHWMKIWCTFSFLMFRFWFLH